MISLVKATISAKENKASFWVFSGTPIGYAIQILISEKR
jgi:hypothetical protein